MPEAMRRPAAELNEFPGAIVRIGLLTLANVA
jgi:hypothetical protein